MSFASETKKELTQIHNRVCCEQAELFAMIRMNGTLHDAAVDGMKILDIQTENAAIARRIYTLVRAAYYEDIQLLVQKKMRLKKNNIYIIRLKGHVFEFLQNRHLVDANGNWQPVIPPTIIEKICCKRGFLKGAFLSGGSVNNPETSAYHLEIYCYDQKFSEQICEVMQSLGMNARTIERKKGYITYLKEAEKIADFLSLVGAVQAMLRLEDVRIVRDMRNSVNRLVNCETANLNKTISASVRQIEDIRFIQNRVGLDALPPKLREIAEIRLENEEVTLKELGEMLPSGPISKSGVNHRLRKIAIFAEQLKSANHL